LIAYVVTESDFEVEILNRLLPADLTRDVQILAGGGINGVVSIARSLVASRRRPLAMVIDADSPEPEILEMRRQSMEEVVGSVAPNVPIRVIVAVPEFETIFFEAPEVLKRIYKKRFSHSIAEVAELSIRKAFEKLDPGSSKHQIYDRILTTLTNKDAKSLRKTKAIQEVMDFLRVAHENADHLPATSTR
jgi:hypothetical protein